MITTTAALQKGIVSLDDEFEITNGANVGGRFIENANGEYCGGTFREAFAESCNADFAPLGPEIGNDDLVADRGTVRLQLAADALRIADRRRSRTGRIDHPDRDRRRSRPRRQRDRAGRGAGDAAGDGERRPDDRQRRRARADLDRRQREAAARGGAGAGDVEEDRRRADRTDGRRRHRRHRLRRGDPRGPGGGQDRHRRARPRPGEENSPHPQQRKDAWFAAFAPADHAKLAIGVLLVEAEAAGGEVAAPAAAQVLSAGL